MDNDGSLTDGSQTPIVKNGVILLTFGVFLTNNNGDDGELRRLPEGANNTRSRRINSTFQRNAAA